MVVKTNSVAASTNKKSNINVHIVVTVSRTKTKRNDIKTLYIYVGIRGLVQLSRDMQQHFTIRQPGLMKLIRVVTVARISHVLGYLLLRYPAIHFLSQQTKIGKCVLVTCRRCTNLENAITQRNSSEPTISGSI